MKMDFPKNITIPPNPGIETNQLLKQLIASNETVATAALTGGIVAAMGRPVSLMEVLEIQQNTRFALFPGRGSRYEAWLKEKETLLNIKWD